MGFCGFSHILDNLRKSTKTLGKHTIFVGSGPQVRPQIGPKSIQHRPPGGSWGPRNAQDLPGPLPRRSQDLPGPPQDPPGLPQEGPKGFPGPPKIPPKASPRRPGASREAPRSPPGRPREPPGSPPGPPGTPQEHPGPPPGPFGTARDPQIADFGPPEWQFLNGIGGRFGQASGPPREHPKLPNCLFGHREIANFEWVWGSLWARIGTATQPIHPPINLTAQLLKRGGGSARQGNWIEKSMAVFYASASLPRRNKPNDQINKKRPHKRTTKKPHNASRGPGGMRVAIE